MIADPAAVVLTAHVAHWADDSPIRTVWLLECLARHNAGDWGDLDPHDVHANSHAHRARAGRIMSRYVVPDELTDPSGHDDAIWIITDDVADPDSVTTILWPSDY